MANFDEEIAAAMAVYTPPIPEPSSEGFLPLIDRPETKVVSVKDGYRSATGPSKLVQAGSLAVRLAEDDQAALGYVMVSHDAATGECVFQYDAQMAARASLRKSYIQYRENWGSGASRRLWNGLPDSPAVFCRKLANGEPMYPQPEPEPVIDPKEKRMADLEKEVAATVSHDGTNAKVVMGRHWFNSGHNDRKGRRVSVGSNICCPGGVQKPYTPPAPSVSEADIAALEQKVEDLKRSLAGQAENRRQEIARERGAQ